MHFLNNHKFKWLHSNQSHKQF